MKPLETYESNGINFLLAKGSTLAELREAPYIIRKGGSLVFEPGSLIPMGGAADSQLGVIAEAVGDANLVVVTTPTGKEAESFDSYEARFRELGVSGKITQINRQTSRNEGVDILEDKTVKVVFTVGGNQLTAVEALENADLLPAFRAARKRGVIHAGTSAGASYMGAQMPMSIHSDDSASLGTIRQEVVRFVKGGGLTDLVIDQHVKQRRREGRVLAGAKATGRRALGLDEATGVVIPPHGKAIRTFGAGETHLSHKVGGDTTLTSVRSGVIVDYALTNRLKSFPVRR